MSAPKIPGLAAMAEQAAAEKERPFEPARTWAAYACGGKVRLRTWNVDGFPLSEIQLSPRVALGVAEDLLRSARAALAGTP